MLNFQTDTNISKDLKYSSTKMKIGFNFDTLYCILHPSTLHCSVLDHPLFRVGAKFIYFCLQ